MKWYKHLFIYLGCIAFTELTLVGFFLAAQFDGRNIWNAFGWIQLAVPLVAFVLPFLMVETFISVDNKRNAQEEWYAKVNKMLEKYEKENEDE